jgi:hypothetical protein
MFGLGIVELLVLASVLFVLVGVPIIAFVVVVPRGNGSK